MNLNIINNQAENRFETTVEGHLAVVEYKLMGKQIALVHTGVPEEIGGRGIASQLAKFSLEYARDNELTVLPYCPFINSYIKQHSEYAGLVEDSFNEV